MNRPGGLVGDPFGSGETRMRRKLSLMLKEFVQSITKVWPKRRYTRNCAAFY
jgi:hypothetical protein